MIDADFWPRIDLLAELMLISPNGKMRDLQGEALKHYPVASRELERYLRSWRVRMIAARRANEIAEVRDA